MKLKIHPLAEMIPAMSDEEYHDLREDIKENGQAEPITLYRGEVLDGRHRARACEELGVQPLIREYTGSQPAAYVVSLNVKRRNLTPSQIAMVGADLLPHLEAEARERMSKAGQAASPGKPAEKPVPDGTPFESSKRAAQEAAELTGSSARSVGRAKRIKTEAPDLAEKVRAGELTVTAADEELRKPAAGKREAAQSSKRLHNLVHTFINTQTLLRETNVDAAMQTITTKEATTWAQQLRSVRTDLTRLVTALEARK